MNIPNQLPTFTATARRYSDWLAWWHGIWKSALHSASGAVLAGASTNVAATWGPAGWVNGMDWAQVVAAFFGALFIGAMRYVNRVTRPGNTLSPFR